MEWVQFTLQFSCINKKTDIITPCVWFLYYFSTGFKLRRKEIGCFYWITPSLKIQEALLPSWVPRAPWQWYHHSGHGEYSRCCHVLPSAPFRSEELNSQLLRVLLSNWCLHELPRPKTHPSPKQTTSTDWLTKGCQGPAPHSNYRQFWQAILASEFPMESAEIWIETISQHNFSLWQILLPFQSCPILLPSARADCNNSK